MTGCRVSILSIFHQSPKKAFFQENLIFFAALISLLYQYISIYIYISISHRLKISSSPASGPSGTAVEAAEVVLLWQNSWRCATRFSGG